MIKGIDVSHNNGAINWQKLKATGKVQFAVIRICHGITLDRQFMTNLAACKRLKIPYAFYVYAEADNSTGAQAEAKYALSKIAGTSPLFVAYDAECAALAAKSKNITTDIACAFLALIKAAGYTPYLYTNENWRRNEIDVQYLKNKGCGFWYARYNGNTPQTANYSNMCDIWQYSCTTNLSGNGSSAIDLDVSYNAAIISKVSGTPVSANYCDTTVNFIKPIGTTYQFKSGSPITCGNGNVFKKVSQAQNGGYYLTKFQATGKGCAGFYLNGKRVCMGTVK